MSQPPGDDTPITVSISILDRDYQVTCTAAERDELVNAAGHLDEKMRQIRTTGRVTGLDRIAVMAALNLTHESRSSDSRHTQLIEGTQHEIERISAKLSRALDDLRQLDV